jgi:hypothetical protein
MPESRLASNGILLGGVRGPGDGAVLGREVFTCSVTFVAAELADEGAFGGLTEATTTGGLPLAASS